MEQAVYRHSFGGRAFEDYRHSEYLEHDGAPTPPIASRDAMPLFLSDPTGQPEPNEFAPMARRGHGRLAARLVAGGLALAGAAVLVTVYQSDVARSLITQAKASISGLTEQQPAMPKRVPAPPVFADTTGQAGVPTQLASTRPSDVPAAALPTREAILSAYQSALQKTPGPSQAAGSASLPSPEASAPAVQPHPLDPDTLAALMKRANGMLAIGDITGARLLLERAANAQDATAALLLAQTYDPAVLGVRDIRSITPDPAMARDWYQKAARFGSQDARQRLSQLNN